VPYLCFCVDIFQADPATVRNRQSTESTVASAQASKYEHETLEFVPESDAEANVRPEEVVGGNAIVRQHDGIADRSDTISTLDVRVIARHGLLGFVQL